jgi:hypothetical protein
MSSGTARITKAIIVMGNGEEQSVAFPADAEGPQSVTVEFDSGRTVHVDEDGNTQVTDPGLNVQVKGAGVQFGPGTQVNTIRGSFRRP